MENLYRHWDELTVFGATPKSIGNVILPTLKKKDVFINKMLVIPPFYHEADVDARSKKVKVSELTSMYSKLISDVQFKTTTVTSFDIIANASNLKIQEQLMLISTYLLTKVAKKRGYIRRRLLSKTVDYGIRSVLTAPSFTGKNIDLDTLEYDKIYIPVSLLTTAAYPFIIRNIKEFFADIENRITYSVPHGSKDDWVIQDPESQFDLQYIETMVNNYNKFTEIRFKPIKVKIENLVTGEVAEVKMKEEKTFYTDKEMSSPARTVTTDVTITDICFRAAYDSCYDRYAMATRYPVLGVYGIFFAKVDILSTNDTVPVSVGGMQYPKYPVINPSLPKNLIAPQFINTIKFSLSRLGGLEHATSPLNALNCREVA